MHKILATVALLSATEAKVDFNFVNSYMSTALGRRVESAMPLCVSNSLAAEQDLEASVQDFATQSNSRAREGVHKMGLVMTNIANAMKECNAYDDDVEYIN